MNAIVAAVQALSTGRNVLGACASDHQGVDRLADGRHADTEYVRAAGRFYIHLVRVLGATSKDAVASTREAYAGGL